jgi:HAD superfamily hydrolase (TIGR01549 family)
MTSTLLLFDLDETVAPDDAVNGEVFREVVGDTLADDGTDLGQLHAEFDAIIERLWQSGPAADYTARIGISAWEGLWGPFGPSEHPMLGTLHTFVPTYRAAAWGEFVDSRRPRAAAPPRVLEARFQETRRARQRAYPWSAPVLESLAARYRLGMITNGAPDLQRLKLEGTGLKALFDPLVISGDLDVGKPERAIFAYALRRAGVEPGDAVMVGDSWGRDMLGAIGAEMRGVWINPEDAALPAITALARVQSIRDLRDLPRALADDTLSATEARDLS